MREIVSMENIKSGGTKEFFEYLESESLLCIVEGIELEMVGAHEDYIEIFKTNIQEIIDLYLNILEEGDAYYDEKRWVDVVVKVSVPLKKEELLVIQEELNEKYTQFHLFLQANRDRYYIRLYSDNTERKINIKKYNDTIIEKIKRLKNRRLLRKK